jgi:hypothetical protein
MAEGDETIHFMLLTDDREVSARFVGDEVQREFAFAPVGAAEAEAVVGDHVAPGFSGEQGGEVAPQVDAAQGIVQQDDGRFLAAGLVLAGAVPEPAEQAAVRVLDPDVAGENGGWLHPPIMQQA